MKKFVVKIAIYTILILLGLEMLVRIFHFHKDRPFRYLDEYNVEKWIPNQNGIWVTGNRRMNAEYYRINSFGFNSVYDDYYPKTNEKEIALVGDSFIQGFHQDIHDSLGQKLENLLNEDYKVLEFGYAAYDLADQLHLINAYKHLFNKIDHVVIYMYYPNDLERGTYSVSNRLALNTPLNRFLKKIKTVVYLKDIGLLDPINHSIKRMTNLMRGTRFSEVEPGDPEKEDLLKLENFKRLIEKYGYDKHKNVLLLDYDICSPQFLTYLEQNEFKTIDFSTVFEVTKIPPTLIYDLHWSSHGRSLIANLIAKYIESE